MLKLKLNDIELARVLHIYLGEVNKGHFFVQMGQI